MNTALQPPIKTFLPVAGYYLLTASQVLAQAGTPGPSSNSLENPLNDSITDIPALLLAILNIIVIVMIPIVIFFIVYAGFLFVTAQGNAEQVENAKRALLYALIGGVLIIGAEAITAIIEQVVADFQA